VGKQHMIDTDEILLQTRQPRGPDSISSLVEVDLAGLSHPGLVRSNNEDQFFVARFDRAMRTLATNLPEGSFTAPSAETVYAMLVADGMGGHAAGEVASRTAVSVLVDQVLRSPAWIMRLDDQVVAEAMSRMEQRLEQVQDVLAQRARAEPGLSGMGTTLTLAWSLGADLLLAHVGDSRAYLFRQGQLQQLTHDQTVTQEMVDTGALSPEEAATHRLRHVLTGALSTSARRLRVEFRRLLLAEGDQVLLCSDGLSDLVPQADLAEVLRQGARAEDACRVLVDRALAAGGKDNVTVVLARYHLPPQAS
jgi:protein phosphatase